jgi:hypothetical protein
MIEKVSGTVKLNHRCKIKDQEGVMQNINFAVGVKLKLFESGRK